MDKSPCSVCLIVNHDSGSNSAGTIDGVRDVLGDGGHVIAREVCFPEDDLPTPTSLDDGGIDLVAIFTGDGSINAAITALKGWGGTILVLPGGTMNLMAKRLHGDADASDILAKFTGGDWQVAHPTVIDTGKQTGLSGILVGPGTAWNTVREAMRGLDIAGIAEGAASALDESLSGNMAYCKTPQVGRDQGYPLILLSPESDGIAVQAFYSETAGEYAQQAFALLRRDFREGPHDDLGTFDSLTIAQHGTSEVAMLVDGEPIASDAPARFRLGRLALDLVATV